MAKWGFRPAWSKATAFAYDGTGSGLACETNCTIDYNVSGDGSANTGGSTHNVTNWTPNWFDATNYQPLGLPFQAGYQGGGGAA